MANYFKVKSLIWCYGTEAKYSNKFCTIATNQLFPQVLWFARGSNLCGHWGAPDESSFAFISQWDVFHSFQDLRTVTVMLFDGLFRVFSGDQGDTILVVIITALSHKIQSSIWLLCSRKKWQYGIWKPSWRNLRANLKKGKLLFRNQSEKFVWEGLGWKSWMFLLISWSIKFPLRNLKCDQSD